jgi:hypothetical protein
MNTYCERIRETLASEGARALREDEAAQRHVAECDACFALLEAASELDSQLSALPAIDAPDEVVNRLLDQPELGARAGAPLAEAPETPGRWHRLADWLSFERGFRPGPLAWGTGAAATLVLAVSFTFFLSDRQSAPAESQRLVVREYMPPPPAPSEDLRGPFQYGPAGKVAGAESDPAKSPVLPETTSESARVGEDARSELWSKNERAERKAKDDESLGYSFSRSQPTPEDRIEVETSGEIFERSEIATYTLYSDEFIQDLPVPGRYYQNVLTPAPGVQDPDGYGNRDLPDSRERDYKAVVSGVSNVDPLSGAKTKEADPSSVTETEGGAFRENFDFGATEDRFGGTRYDSQDENRDRSLQTAREFLGERDSLEGLEFAEPKGYWTNSYVPGDPALRLLQARLLRADRSILQISAAPIPRLHDAARRTSQPFDPPEHSALTAYLHADKSGLTEEGRLLVQVGLAGTPRHGGRRPALNLGVVLDLRGQASDEIAGGMRALVSALGRVHESGDRFRLYVAGRPGGQVVGPDDFKYGYLTVTMNRLLGSPESRAGATLGLVDATKAAIETVAGADDPEAPLGSSAVLLITGQPLGGVADTLNRMAHQSAVAGIPLSVVGVGGEVQLAEIDRLTLAGQGNRRLLAAPADAAGLIDRELSSASRAIARAVRLRIRLAPGVKLVDVLGSERLDAAGARRVREAERSVDLRLSRNLGIEADRGEDEDGLQIVIPSFYAGDDHVILLDVTASGPGPVAEVVVRYKDLVYLRNGVARASLALAGEADVAGPLERNVIKNLLARRLSETLEQAARLLRAGDRAGAAAALTEFQLLLAGMRLEMPGLDNDPELGNDIAMLAEYRALLEGDAVDQPAQLAYLSDSLRYAARLRVLPPPLLN